MKPSYAVLVNSCDRFSDTWYPFFEMYRRNAADLNIDGLFLVTERSEYEHEGLQIRCTKANRSRDSRLSWSECLIDALDQIDTDLVLYLQDDYFFDREVDAEFINRMAEKMAKDPSIGRIGLTFTGSYPPFKPTNDPELLEVGTRARYRITCQACLWRKDVLCSYLRPEENGWMFEIYGTRRAWRRNDVFLNAAFDRPVPIAYVHTGIIKGKWHRAMPEIFARYGIPMDFEKRGFYDAPPLLQRKWETFRTLLNSPGRLVRGLMGR